MFLDHQNRVCLCQFRFLYLSLFQDVPILIEGLYLHFMNQGSDLIIISTFGILMNGALVSTYLDCLAYYVTNALKILYGTFTLILNMTKYAKIKLLVQKVNFTYLNVGMSLYLL